MMMSCREPSAMADSLASEQLPNGGASPDEGGSGINGTPTGVVLASVAAGRKGTSLSDSYGATAISDSAKLAAGDSSVTALIRSRS